MFALHIAGPEVHEFVVARPAFERPCERPLRGLGRAFVIELTASWAEPTHRPRTPANSGRRRHFKHGEVMLDFQNPLWTTLWQRDETVQWDDNQRGSSGMD